MDQIDMAKQKTEKPSPEAPQDSDGMPAHWWSQLTATERGNLFGAWAELHHSRVITAASRQWLRDALHPEGDSISQLVARNRHAGRKTKKKAEFRLYYLELSALYARSLIESGAYYKVAIFDALKKYNVIDHLLLKEKDVEFFYSSIRNSGRPIPPLAWFDEAPDAAVIAAYNVEMAAWDRQRFANLSQDEIVEEGGLLVDEWLQEGLYPSLWSANKDLREFIRSLLREPADRWNQLAEEERLPEFRGKTLNTLTEMILIKVERICIEEILSLLKVATDKESRQRR